MRDCCKVFGGKIEAAYEQCKVLDGFLFSPECIKRKKRPLGWFWNLDMGTTIMSIVVDWSR